MLDTDIPTTYPTLPLILMYQVYLSIWDSSKVPVTELQMASITSTTHPSLSALTA